MSQLIEECLERIASGTMRVDLDTGMVYQTFSTLLYTYERPVGSLGANGYVYISLGRSKTVYAHRLVWAAAHGDLDPDLLINHKNGIKHDNRLSNLEQVTARANIVHAYRMGLIPSGDDHYRRKVTDAQVAEIHEWLSVGAKPASIARFYAVSPALVHLIKRGERARYIQLPPPNRLLQATVDDLPARPL